MKIPSRVELRTGCLCLAFFTGAASGQTVTVSVDATQTVRIVDERIFGVNAVIWDPEVSSAQTQQLVRDAGIRIIRVPGGSLSNVYHWSMNRSQKSDATGIAYEDWQWASGFDKHSALILGANTEAFVSVNYGTGTPQEAAAWVAYANSAAGTEGTAGDVTIGTDAKGIDWKTARYWANLRAATPLATDDGYNFLRLGRTGKIGIRHWEVGNENYGTWERDDQPAPHDPATYGTRASAYIDAMKAVDATIKVGVVVAKGTEYNSWTRTVLTTLKNLSAQPDFLVYHRYEQGPGAETDAGLLQSARTWPADAADLRQQLQDHLGEPAASNVELLVTENNSVYTDPGKQSTSLVNGLFLADSVGSLLQTEINALTWWDLRNSPPINQTTQQLLGNLSPSLYGWRAFGDYGMLSTPGTTATPGVQLATTYYDKYPTYYAMKLLSYFARGGDEVVNATSNNTLLATYAVRRDAESSLRLLVINKSPSATLTGNFTVTGFAAPAAANLYSYGIPNDNAAKPGAAGCADIAGSTLALTGSAISAVFAPYSMTVIALGGPAIPVAGGTPVITTQPASSTVTSGQAASFSVAASSCQAFSYQWQRQAAGASTWQDLAADSPYGNGTTSSLSIAATTAALSGDQFRVTVTNADGSVTSDAATLTVNASTPPPPPPSGGGNSGGGGGGGGGAIGLWLLTLLGFGIVRRR